MLNLMKTIKISAGNEAIVDDSDYPLLSLIKWTTNKKENISYAWHRWFGKMHRFIMAADTGMHVDHIDGNGLNNQRSNLRICTPGDNYKNRRKIKIGLSKYKGVKFEKRNTNRPWVSFIYTKTTHTYLGCFKTEEEAAKAYDVAALKRFKEFANLNFKDQS